LDLCSSKSDELGLVHNAFDRTAICVVVVSMIDGVLAFLERVFNYVDAQ
jgi:hypothetical protein